MVSIEHFQRYVLIEVHNENCSQANQRKVTSGSFMCVCMVRTFKVYTLSKFQVCGTESVSHSP